MPWPSIEDITVLENMVNHSMILSFQQIFDKPCPLSMVNISTKRILASLLLYEE